MVTRRTRQVSLSRGLAGGTSSRNAARSAGRPRIDPASTSPRARDRASPCPRRSADSGFGDRRQAWARFYNIASVIPAVVLAAGRSSRMGRAKALLPIGDDTFLTRIVRTLLDAGVDDVVVVVGHDAESIVRDFSASGLPARFVVNREYDRGQLSSLLAGLAVIEKSDRKSTRLNSSHDQISYAVFCLKKQATHLFVVLTLVDLPN